MKRFRISPLALVPLDEIDNAPRQNREGAVRILPNSGLDAIVVERVDPAVAELAERRAGFVEGDRERRKC